MKAPRPKLLASAGPTVVGDVVTLARPAAAIAGKTLVAIVVGDAGLTATPAGWTQAFQSGSVGGVRWTVFRLTLLATHYAAQWSWTFAAGTLDPAGVLLVYDDVAPGIVIGATATDASVAVTNHSAPTVTAESATYEEICCWYEVNNTPITPPATMQALVAASLPAGHETFAVARKAPIDAVPTLPVRTGTSGVATSASMLSVVIRDDLPGLPALLADLVPGNIGIAPQLPRPRPTTAAYATHPVGGGGGGTPGPLPTWVSTGAKAFGVGDVSPAWGSHLADDIGVLVIESDAGQAAAMPAGWTEFPNSPQNSASVNGSRLTVGWKRATSGAEAAPLVVDPGNHCIAYIVVFRGCTTGGNPYDITAGDAIGADSTAVSVPGGTTTIGNCLIVLISSCGADGQTTGQFSAWANADLANVTERADAFDNSGSGGGIAVATGEKAAAGAFGATTATIATTGGQGHLMVALKPPVS